MTSVREAPAAEGAIVEAPAPTDGAVTGSDGAQYTVDRALPTVASVRYDAALLPGGEYGAPAAAKDPDALS